MCVYTLKFTVSVYDDQSNQNNMADRAKNKKCLHANMVSSEHSMNEILVQNGMQIISSHTY